MTEENDIRLIDLDKLLDMVIKVIRRFWIPILSVVGVCALLCVAFSLLTYVPYYESQATLTINTVNSSLIVGTGDAQVKESLPYILDSQYMRNLVLDDLAMDSFPAEIRLESKELANLFILTVRSRDAETASLILNSVLKNCSRASIHILGKISFEVLDQSGVVNAPVNRLEPLKDMAKGIFIGLVLSGAVLVLYIMTRRTVASEEDLKRYLSIECLASLPQIIFKKRRKEIEKHVHIKNPIVGGFFQEMVRTMRSRVMRAADKAGKKILLVSSSVSEEGKSTVAINLALSLAEKNKKVILVDLDLRNPSVYKHLGLRFKKAFGMNIVLSEKRDWHSLVFHHKTWNMDILGGTSPCSNPIELLNTQSFSAMMAQLREEYDYVILDTPPAAMLSDAVNVAQHADAAIYVVKQDYARIERIAEGMDAFSVSRLPILGVIMNGMESVGRRYGGYHSYYGRYGRYGGYGSYGRRRDSQTDNSSDFIDLDNSWEQEI